MQAPCVRIAACILLFVLTSRISLLGQDSVRPSQDSVPQVDATVVARMFGKEAKTETKPKKSNYAILPWAYNPSFGFIIGAKLTGGTQFGDPQT
jgi:hypothetical protein